MACRRRIRTLDLRVMGPASCRCSILLYRRVSPASMRIKGGSSRRLNAFGFMVHYNISKPNSVNKSNKLYATNINLSNSILTLSAVAFRPIRTATCAQVNSSNILYRIIRCILGETVLSHAST